MSSSIGIWISNWDDVYDTILIPTTNLSQMLHTEQKISPTKVPTLNQMKGTAKFACDHCPKTFKYSKSLNRHKQSVMSINNDLALFTMKSSKGFPINKKSKMSFVSTKANHFHRQRTISMQSISTDKIKISLQSKIPSNLN